MIDVDFWMDRFLYALNQTFRDRVCFVGLQGSYARGEATETSDIDIVVILDELSVSDIETYNAMLNTLSHRELICGFLSGKAELLNWETSDLFQFYHDTKPMTGNLDALLPHIDDAAVSRAIKTGACNIYHGCVHNMLHEKSDEIMRALYKSASFVVQAIYFRQTGRYIGHLEDLIPLLSTNDQAVIDTYIALKRNDTIHFKEMSEKLFVWAKHHIENAE